MSLFGKGTGTSAVGQIVALRCNAVVEGYPIVFALVRLFAGLADFDKLYREVFDTVLLHCLPDGVFEIVRVLPKTPCKCPRRLPDIFLKVGTIHEEINFDLHFPRSFVIDKHSGKL